MLPGGIIIATFYSLSCQQQRKIAEELRLRRAMRKGKDKPALGTIQSAQTVQSMSSDLKSGRLKSLGWVWITGRHFFY
jgi:hypothetical protein